MAGKVWATSEWGRMLIREFEDLRLRAYQCSANKWTIGYGSTFYPDGRPVRKGDKITEAEAEPLLTATLRPFEDAVNRAMEGVTLTQYQFDAMVAYAYNAGVDAFRSSSVCEAMRNNRPDLAATSFEAVTGSTSMTPHREALNDRAFASKIGYKDGKPYWIGPDGRPCGYMRRLSGLLRRHLAESLLFTGRDWRRACAPGAIHLIPQPPESCIWDSGWNKGMGRWKERTHSATSHMDAYMASDPLPDLDEVELFESGPPPEPAGPPDVDIDETDETDGTMDDLARQAPEIVTRPWQDEDAPVVAPVPAPPAKAPPPPAPVVRPPPYVPHGEIGATPKDMVRSRRFWGLFLIIVGRMGSVLGLSSGVVTTISDPVVAELVTPILIMGGSYAVERVGDYVQHIGRKGARTVLQ